MFKYVDSKEKSYVLGYIASGKNISQSSCTISIQINHDDIDCLKKLQNIVSDDLLIISLKDQLIKIEIDSKEICVDVCNLLRISECKKYDNMNLPRLDDIKLTWAFIRGYFDGVGTISNTSCRYPTCCILSESANMLTDICNFVGIPLQRIENELKFSGTNCIDFLGKLYGDVSNEFYSLRKYKLYLDWLNWKPTLGSLNDLSTLGTCKVFKTNKAAILPYKSNMSDVGYDLTIINAVKKNHKNTTLFDTCIKIKLEYGYYAEIVPRSSLSKSGYMLSNSIGIIDNSYRGNLYISLTKIEPDAPDLKLPFKCCQLIVREQVHINMIEVDDEFDDNTVRDNGGFGSTDNKVLS